MDTRQGNLTIGGTFPSREDRQALLRAIQAQKWSLDHALGDDDRWRWHGYDYGWRRVCLGTYARVSPIDPYGAWFDLHLADTAERFWRAATGRKVTLVVSSPSSQDAVRSHWRQIPGNQITRAEHAIADPEIARMAAEARRNIQAFIDRGRGAFPGPRRPVTPQAREITPGYLDGGSPELRALMERG